MADYPVTVDATGATQVGVALQAFVDAVPSGNVFARNRIVFATNGRYSCDYQAIRLENKAFIDVVGNGSTIISSDPQGLSHVSAADSVRRFRIRTSHDIRVFNLSILGPMSQYLDDYDNWHGAYNADLENRMGFAIEGCQHILIQGNGTTDFVADLMGDAFGVNAIGKGNRIPGCTIGASADRMTVVATNPDHPIKQGAQNLVGRLVTGQGIQRGTVVVSVAGDQMSARISKPAAALSTAAGRGENEKLASGNRDGAFTLQAPINNSDILIQGYRVWNLGRHVLTPQGAFWDPVVMDSTGADGRGIEINNVAAGYYRHHFSDAQSDYDFPNELMVNVRINCDGDADGTGKTWGHPNVINGLEGVAVDGLGQGSSHAFLPTKIHNPGYVGTPSPMMAKRAAIRAAIPVVGVIPPPDFVGQPNAPDATITPTSALVKWGSNWPIDTCTFRWSSTQSGGSLTGTIHTVPNSSIVYDAQRNNMQTTLTGLTPADRIFVEVVMHNAYGDSPPSNVPNNPIDTKPGGGGGGGAPNITAGPTVLSIDPDGGGPDGVVTVAVVTDVPSLVTTRKMLGPPTGTWVAGPADAVAKTAHVLTFPALATGAWGFELTCANFAGFDVGIAGAVVPPLIDDVPVPNIVPGSAVVTPVAGGFDADWTTDISSDSALIAVEQAKYGDPAALKTFFSPANTLHHHVHAGGLPPVPHVVRIESN